VSKRSDHIDPQYANKETRTRLGDKSKICFETRGKWKKLALRLGLTVTNVEAQMDEIIKIKEEQKGELDESPRQSTTRTSRRKYLREFAKKMRKNSYKVRFGKDNDGTTTESGTGGDSESPDVRSEEVQSE